MTVLIPMKKFLLPFNVNDHIYKVSSVNLVLKQTWNFIFKCFQEFAYSRTKWQLI